MSQPVKLSDAIVLDARIAGEAQQRSIAGQVEFWARLGRSLDELLDGRARKALRENAEQKPLSELILSVGTKEGKARLKAYLDSRPYPHFEPHPTRKGFLVRIERDGSRSIGRFVNRVFIVDHEEKSGFAVSGNEISHLLESKAVDRLIVECLREHYHIDLDPKVVLESLHRIAPLKKAGSLTGRSLQSSENYTKPKRAKTA